VSTTWGGLGDELFWQAIHTFVQDNAHKTVETIDLLRLKKLLGVISYFSSTSTFIAAVIPILKLAYSWDGIASWLGYSHKQTKEK